MPAPTSVHLLDDSLLPESETVRTSPVLPSRAPAKGKKTRMPTLASESSQLPCATWIAGAPKPKVSALKPNSVVLWSAAIAPRNSAPAAPSVENVCQPYQRLARCGPLESFAGGSRFNSVSGDAAAHTFGSNPTNTAQPIPTPSTQARCTIGNLPQIVH